MSALPAGEALRPLPTGYLQLYEQVLAAAEADDRIRALWLSGSLGRGVADAGSDLDVVLAVDEAAFTEFTVGWREWLARATPTVLARELPRLPGSWHCMTPDCLRFDVVTERAGTATPAQLAGRLPVLDKDGAATGPGCAPDPEQGPDPAKIAAITEEFLRQQAIFPAAVVARAAWLLGVVGVVGAHTMLYELFVQANQPLPPRGVKQWSAKLTAEQRRACVGLRVPIPERDSVVAAMRAAATEFRNAARQVHRQHDVPWPDDLDAAVLRYQQATLGWTW